MANMSLLFDWEDIQLNVISSGVLKRDTKSKTASVNKMPTKYIIIRSRINDQINAFNV